MSLFPSVNHAYFMIVQEESQRQHLSRTMVSEPIAFYSFNSTSKRRFNGVSDHFKVKGHKWENCYRLIGYPPDFKFTKKRRSTLTGSVVNNVVATDFVELVDCTSTLNALLAPFFIKAQFQQILDLLNKDSSGEATTSLAGMAFSSEWILDIGATNHMLLNFKRLESLFSCSSSPSCVRLPTSSLIPITYVRTCTVSSTLKLSNVLYILIFVIISSLF